MTSTMIWLTAKMSSTTVTKHIFIRRSLTTSALCRQKARGRARATLTYYPMNSACCIIKHYWARLYPNQTQSEKSLRWIFGVPFSILQMFLMLKKKDWVNMSASWMAILPEYS